MADNDEWNAAARDAANDDAGWNRDRSASPRGNTPSRRDADRERSPAPRGQNGGGGGDAPEERGRSSHQGGGGGGGDGSYNPGNNLHVSGVSKSVTERDLEEAFGKFGKVDRAQVMYDPHSRESRGFAFVTMADPESADSAIANMNGVDLQGRVLSVQRAKRGRARTPTPGRYHGPPKSERFPGPPGGGMRGGYGPPPPMDYRYGPPPPRDPYDRYGPPPPRDPYDRYGPPPPPPRDYPPRDYPPPRSAGYGPPPGRGYSPPPRVGRYDDIPPPPVRGGGRYDDIPPPPRRSGYDDIPPPPRSRYDDLPPRRY